jgi:hypothetical protein
MRKRKVVSLILLFAFIMMPLSAVLVHANHARPFTSHRWLHLHFFVGVVFTAAAFVHVVLNRRAFMAHLKVKK